MFTLASAIILCCCYIFLASFAQLINQRCRGDLQLVELLMNSMLSKLVDPCHLVRRLSIKGLGNVSSVGGQKVGIFLRSMQCWVSP